MARYTVRQLIPKYLRYRWRRRNYKFIHSQFVHELVQAVLATHSKPPEWTTIQEYRNALRADQRTFDYHDFGASGTGQSKFLTISQFQKRIERSGRDQLRLIRFVQWLKPMKSLELGMATGVGTLSLANGNPASHVHTLEGSTDLIKLIEPGLKEQARNITIHPGPFEETLPKVLQDNGPFDCALLDGNHTYEATKRYMDVIKPHLSDEGVLILDDIRWSAGMEKAWNELITHPDFHVTIDLFRWGLLFTRPTQAKEHFVL